MVVSSQNNQKQIYFPNPLEARALMEVGKDWRFYPSKEDFDKTVSELQQTEVSLPSGEKTNAWFAARANVAIAFGKNPATYDAISIENAEKKIKSDKNLWNKIQAMHLYNSAGFRPLLKKPAEIEDVSVILNKINEQLNKIEKGQFVDGKYIPSKAEKNILRTLKNYGRFIRNPKDESEIANFTKHINNAFIQITKREDFQFPSERKGKEKLSRKETTMSDTKEFTLSEEQLEFCKAHDIDTKTITSEEAYKAAVEKIGKETSEKEAPKEEKEGANAADNKEQKPLSVSVNESEPEEKTNEEEPEWVKRKAEYYQKLSDDGKIQGYERDTERQGFAAKFENAEIHYSSPDNVNVSPDAGFKVFDAMFKEPDNQGRPIEFPENASKEVATRMYAACVLNGNPMQGAVPKEIDMEELAKCGLTNEQLEQVKQFYEKKQPQENNQENSHKEVMKEKLKYAFALGKQVNDPDFYRHKYDLTNEEMKPLEGQERTHLKYKMYKELSPEEILDIADLTGGDLKKELEQLADTKELCLSTQQAKEGAAKLGITPKTTYLAGEHEMYDVEAPKNVKPLEGDERKAFLEKMSIEQLQDILTECEQLNHPQTSKEQEITSELKQTIVTKAIHEQTQAREELHQMIKDGKVSLAKDEKSGKVEMTANDQKDLKRALLLTATIKSTQETALNANGNNNEQYRQQQIANLRSRLDPEQAKSRQEKEDARDLIMAARLGIAPEGAKVIDRNGNEVTAKTGEELKKYQAMISPERMSHLTNKFGKGRA